MILVWILITIFPLIHQNRIKFVGFLRKVTSDYVYSISAYIYIYIYILRERHIPILTDTHHYDRHITDTHHYDRHITDTHHYDKHITDTCPSG